jgi:hypothetical protein
MDAVAAGQAALNGAGPLFINEVMADNVSTKSDPQGDFDDWIEIYNASDHAVSLAGMYLTDDLSNPRKWRFPTTTLAKTMVLAHHYVLVWADGDTEASGLHAGFSLSAKGEEVGLADANGVLIDAVSFGPMAADVSFGRLPDGGPSLQYLDYPTPGAGNSTADLSQVQEPLFSHPRGFYSSSFKLTIVCPTPGATILYTTDGTDPERPAIGASTAKVYTSPLTIPAMTGAMRITCVRAVAVMDGRKSSRVITHTYVTNATAGIKSLPLISLVGDAGQTFYEPNGVMAVVGGKYAGFGSEWQSTGAGSYNNMLNRDLERPVSFEWIKPNDGNGMQADCGIRVQASPWTRPRYQRADGDWSTLGRVEYKIAFRLYFRDEYGLGRLEYPLFPFEVQRFNDIVLRAGHNDWQNPFIRDELVRRLFKDMGQVSAGGTLANLTINGQTKGYYNPTEHITEEFCQDWFDSNQPWDVITMFGDVRDGDLIRWNNLISYVQQHNLADDAAYNQVASQVDLENFVDYLVLRLWSGDWDWPQNNWAAACERSSQGKWRFFVWDAEGGMDSSQGVQTVRFGELNSQANEHGYLYRGLKANPRFRALFGDRVYKAFYGGGALTSQNVTKRFNELKGQMAVVLPDMSAYVIGTWVPQRLAPFLDACISEGVYTFASPTLLVNGKAQYGGYAQPGDSLTLTTTEPDSRVFYTLDGVDPGDRLAGGSFGKLSLVLKNSDRRVLVPTKAVDSSWRQAGSFNDSTWLTAGGGVGFGGSGTFAGSYTLNVSKAMSGTNASCLVRIPFTFDTSLQDITSLTLKVQYDSAFVAYLNGVEVARKNFAGEPTWNSHGTAENSDAVAVAFRSFDVLGFAGSLRQGQNILAIHAMNSSASDQDFLINAELIADVKPSLAVPMGLTLYTGPVRLDHTVTVRARAVSASQVSALSEATFSVGPVARGLRISEVMYHGREGGNPADPNTEYVELVNVAGQTINLNQVRLAGGVEFVFPAMDVMPGQFVLVVADPAAFAAQYGSSALVAGQYTGDLSNKGEQIRLVDAAGGLIEQFQYADSWHPITDGRGFSLTVVDPAADPNVLSTRAGWRPSAAIGGSPGWDDAGQAAAIGSVVVNEVMANPAAGQSDWIELHNTTSQPMDIGGWFLSDDKDDLKKYRISKGTVISPAGYVVFYGDRHFGNPGDPGCLRAFGLSAAGEAAILTSGSEGELTGCSDQVTFGPSEPGVSLGRFADPAGQAQAVALTSATPGQANAPPAVGPVVISEVLPRPDLMPEAEFVELFNSGAGPVTLCDSQTGLAWRLLVEDGETEAVALDLPANPGLTLAPGTCALLVKNRTLLALRFTGLSTVLPVVQWDRGNLPDAAARVRLLRPLQAVDGRIEWIDVDVMSYSTTAAGKSWQRSSPSAYGPVAATWRLATPTPGVP